MVSVVICLLNGSLFIERRVGEDGEKGIIILIYFLCVLRFVLFCFYLWDGINCVVVLVMFENF